MSQENSPANTPPTEDVGAETGLRFAYQDAWAATLACSLIDEPVEFTELYCEYHEDVLLKQTDGKFRGIQVKTRQLNGAHWKTDDEAVIKSLCRFVMLDAQFPNQFAQFVFATNHFFYQDLPNGKNLPHVVAEASTTDDPANAPTIVKRLAKKLSKLTTRTVSDVLATLKKTICDANLPKLNDSRKVLREAIIRAYPPAHDSIPSAIDRAADQLAAEARSASSLEHFDSLPAYLSLLPNADAVEARQRIESKRFTPERVRGVLQGALCPSALLRPATASSELSQSEARSRLAKKLEAGGLSVVTINLATDLRAAALHRFLEWRERFGESEALRRYEHLKTLVLKDCASAHEEARGWP